VNGVDRAYRYQGEAVVSAAADVVQARSSGRAALDGAPTIRFVNTYRPVVPLYETVAAAAEGYGWRVVACMSRGIYRSADEARFGSNASVGMELIWTPALLRKSSIGSNLVFSVLAPFAVGSGPRCNLNVFLTHPPLFYAVGGAVSRRRGVPYFVHLMDLYPEVLARAGLLAENSRLYRFLAARSRAALERAAGIIVIGRCMEERLIAQGINPAKIHFIPTCSSTQVYPVDAAQNRFRHRHGLQDKFVVMYSGNMGLLHELDTLLAVARSLAGNDDIRFVFVGNGRRSGLVKAAVNGRARNIRLIDYQADGEELAHSLSAADVHFVSLREGSEGLVVPSKFYGAIAAGRPVIYEGASGGEIARVIRSTGCGIVVKPGDAAALRAAILSLYADRERCQRLSATALEVHRKHYDPARVARAYCRAISGSVTAASETAGARAPSELGVVP
jgi:colanic acid biosynthesis glycosyl transferase WcaI